MRSPIRTFLLVTLTLAQLIAAQITTAGSLGIIPLPQQLRREEGAFPLVPGTRIYVDGASRESGRYLAQKLNQSTGYQLGVVTKRFSQSPILNGILLTTQAANTNLGAEGYELTVTTNAIIIRAPTQTGLFYGVQTLLQLLPADIFSSRKVVGVEWKISCVNIQDWPRFQWRGLMLDVSRHFFTKAEVERLLDMMALHKLNTFHWHLVDDQGWRIEIKKYPKLTSVGAWRDSVGYGIPADSTTAYGPDGRYGGFYTQEDIREVVAYAAARHITVVPEIEMPGHSMAALTAYPQLGCGLGPFTIPLQDQSCANVYNPANPETFEFLENVLTEVFGLFPSKYIHIGGDEVRPDLWEKDAGCQELMKREGLKTPAELQSWFIRRMEKFANTHGKTLVGWTEIAHGGLAKNAVVMDWKGGGLEAASAGHDVVMAPNDYCYFDHYQSLDYTMEPIAIGCYLPLWRVYSFEPLPEGLPAQYNSCILGGEANIWTEYIASTNYLEYMAFPRLSALAEVTWSSKDARNFGDFLSRLKTNEQRLDELGVNYRRISSTTIGGWQPGQVGTQSIELQWDVTPYLTQPTTNRLILDDIYRPITPDLVSEPGKCHIVFEYQSGHPMKIESVALLQDGHEISCDKHPSFAGPDPRDLVARDVVYVLSAPGCKQASHYTIRARVAGIGGDDSQGDVYLRIVN